MGCFASSSCIGHVCITIAAKTPLLLHVWKLLLLAGGICAGPACCCGSLQRSAQALGNCVTVWLLGSSRAIMLPGPFPVLLLLQILLQLL
jgi:hypothetical protein